MRFDPELLQHLREEGLLRVVRHPEADLWIWNYTKSPAELIGDLR